MRGCLKGYTRRIDMLVRIILFLAVLSTACITYPVYCLAQEMPVETADVSPEDVSELIEEAKGYIEEGDKEGAIVTLDLARDLAESLGIYDMLMEIGDLYVRIDTSLREKAIEAWNAAGRCKTTE